jgi:purine nucleosidase
VNQARHKVIFDTDIGTDVDDILALGVLLGSEEVDLVGVTTVYGDVQLRARMISKILRLRGITSVDVYAGVRDPLLKLDPIYWPGHEGVGLLDEVDDSLEVSGTHAVDYLLSHVLANPGQITLLAVGPLTNVALAMLREPRFAASLKRLVIMGGRIVKFGDSWSVAEHNIKCDPEAAHVVFTSGSKIELVPLDVTLRALIRQDGVDAIRSQGSPYHFALADQVARYPGFVDRGGNTFLHDPLAALAVVRSEILTWKTFDVAVELNGKLTRGMTVAKLRDEGAVSVAVELDIDACELEIRTRIAN